MLDKITEPMTMITDYLIGLQCFYFCFKLLPEIQHKKQVSRKFWTLAFLFTGIASICGGTHHGFALVLSGVVLVLVTAVAQPAMINIRAGSKYIFFIISLLSHTEYFLTNKAANFGGSDMKYSFS